MFSWLISVLLALQMLNLMSCIHLYYFFHIFSVCICPGLCFCCSQKKKIKQTKKEMRDGSEERTGGGGKGRYWISLPVGAIQCQPNNHLRRPPVREGGREAGRHRGIIYSRPQTILPRIN